ncbi:hypothetical protein MCOR25_001843 [Pyricularia grisea]|uniref:Uncharacterized protein n=1 Tax=Pyricularia grisea TaxID=148305 RepID=A0A6P8BA63_PYRGI|nr:uncharacterized protein PgNI_03684 [Pyricularia grisea]KAI6379944.1 hypothetical protein MCOR25_001843 [Pyricularia grisea]TLD12703.1 hypothetical protein PgNI_03684 [Pyricularia grisea]
MDTEESLLILRAQYFQCLDVDCIRWPPQKLLAHPDTCYWTWKHLCFKKRAMAKLPVAQYRLVFFKRLLERLGRAGHVITDDPKEDGVLPSIVAMVEAVKKLEQMSASGSPDHPEDMHVTYTVPLFPPGSSSTVNPDIVTLVESRRLVAGSRFTGHRTWDGALHLAHYLVAEQGSTVKGRSVLELGAGAGLLSILCAKYFGAESVIATDGDERVVEEARRNVDICGLGGEEEGQGRVEVERLWWGEDLGASWLHDRLFKQEKSLDVVFGADLIYNEESASALAKTLKSLLVLKPGLKVIISWAIRFPEVANKFLQDCEANGLNIRDLPFTMTPYTQQKGLFYLTAVPLRIIQVSSR